MSAKSGARLHIWTSRIITCIRQLGAIIEADMRKLCHDPTELVVRMTQPAIWLLLFGQAMSHAKVLPSGNVPYIDFIAPGILAQSVLFIAIFFGISLIWEKDMGVLHKILVTPTPRVILVVGRAFHASVRVLPQVLIIYLLSYMLGTALRLDFGALIAVFCIVILSAALFSTFSLIIACIVKKRERFMGIGQVITMPLFFASNSLYSIELMPTWIRYLSYLNPLTYEVDALRSLMIVGQTSHFGLAMDIVVLVGTFIALIGIATKLYPKILY